MEFKSEDKSVSNEDILRRITEVTEGRMKVEQRFLAALAWATNIMFAWEVLFSLNAEGMFEVKYFIAQIVSSIAFFAVYYANKTTKEKWKQSE